MYDKNKIDEIINQTLKQQQLELEMFRLKGDIADLHKEVVSMKCFFEKVSNYPLSEEDIEKVLEMQDYFGDILNMIDVRDSELNKILDILSVTKKEDYLDRCKYIADFLEFNAVCFEIKNIEKASKKHFKTNPSDFENLISAEGRKKKIQKCDALKYKELVKKKKNLNTSLNKLYKEVVENYDKEVARNKINVTIDHNVVEEILPTEVVEKNLAFVTHNVSDEEWIKYKYNFKNYILDVLKLDSLKSQQQLLAYFDEGLAGNIDFIMFMHDLGYSSEAIDFIISKYNCGPKREGLEDNIGIISNTETIKAYFQDSDEYKNISIFDTTKNIKEKVKGKVVSFVKKKVEKVKKINIKRSLENATIFVASAIVLSNSSVKVSKEVKKYLDNKPLNDVKPYSIEMEYKNLNQQILEKEIINTESVESENVLIGQTFNVLSDCFIYTNMYDANSKSNGVVPYYDANVSRVVKALIVEVNGDIVIVNDNVKLNSLLEQGGKIVSVLSKIDDFTEGFYNISDTNLIKGQVL